MMGMEKMIAGMLGMTPEEIKAKANDFETFVKTGVDALAEISAKQTVILERLERLENVAGK